MLCRPGTYFTRSSTDKFFFKVVILDLEILLALSARDSWGLLSFLSSLSDVIDSAVSLLLEDSFSVEGQGSELFVVSWLDVDPIFSKELNASLFASLNVVKNVGRVGEWSSMKWMWCYANFLHLHIKLPGGDFPRPSLNESLKFRVCSSSSSSSDVCWSLLWLVIYQHCNADWSFFVKCKKHQHISSLIFTSASCLRLFILNFLGGKVLLLLGLGLGHGGGRVEV